MGPVLKSDGINSIDLTLNHVLAAVLILEHFYCSPDLPPGSCFHHLIVTDEALIVSVLSVCSSLLLHLCCLLDRGQSGLATSVLCEISFGCFSVFAVLLGSFHHVQLVTMALVQEVSTIILL